MWLMPLLRTNICRFKYKSFFSDMSASTVAALVHHHCCTKIVMNKFIMCDQNPTTAKPTKHSHFFNFHRFLFSAKLSFFSSITLKNKIAKDGSSS
jgi:hypothetical protein